MDNFLFSLNSTMPVFLVIVIGYILKQKGMLNDEFVRVANKFNFKVTLPALLIKDISSAKIKEVFDYKYVLYCAIVTLICVSVIWLLSKIFIKDKSIVGAFVQASYRGSAAVLGIAFITNMYGNSGMAPLMIIGSVPIYNIFAVIILTFEANGNTNIVKKDKIKAAFINILKNPIIWGIFIGLLISITGIEFPKLINKTISNLASMASPLALIAIGAGFKGSAAIKKIKPTIAAAMIKLMIQPALFLPVAIMLGFTNEKLIAILVMLASPTTPSCYIMAKNMDNDGELTSSVVVATTFLSAFTLTFWVYILKSLNLI